MKAQINLKKKIVKSPYFFIRIRFSYGIPRIQMNSKYV
jgi:hypothetical protein